MKCFTDKYSKLGCDEKFLARLKIIKKKKNWLYGQIVYRKFGRQIMSTPFFVLIYIYNGHAVREG